MTALASAPTLFDELGAAPTLDDELGAEPTLDDMISGAWEGLSAHRSLDCLMCGEPMTPEYGVHALPIGGRCRSCDSTLR
jgi:hypothetical protein